MLFELSANKLLHCYTIVCFMAAKNTIFYYCYMYIQSPMYFCFELQRSLLPIKSIFIFILLVFFFIFLFYFILFRPGEDQQQLNLLLKTEPKQKNWKLKVTVFWLSLTACRYLCLTYPISILKIISFIIHKNFKARLGYCMFCWN